MSGFRYVIPVLLALVGGGGCTAPGAKVESWIHAQGGISSDPERQARVDRVATCFGPELHGAPLRVRVLSAEGVAAYGWPCGELFVTRGLVDLLDDQELAAAIAHEMGHLLDGGSERALAGLSGSGDADANLTIEAKADSLGVDLLRRHHLPPDAMPRMLAKVRGGSALDAPCREALRQRIELLRSLR